MFILVSQIYIATHAQQQTIGCYQNIFFSLKN